MMILYISLELDKEQFLFPEYLITIDITVVVDLQQVFLRHNFAIIMMGRNVM